ncbi:hypothetical protein D3C73_581980 [compost metagenome]
MGAQHVDTVAQPISSMGDEGNDHLAGQVVGAKERADHRRGGHAPDRHAQIDGIVATDIGDEMPERRQVLRLRFAACLFDRRFVILRIGRLRLDIEQRCIHSPPDLAGYDGGVSRSRIIGDEDAPRFSSTLIGRCLGCCQHQAGGRQRQSLQQVSSRQFCSHDRPPPAPGFVSLWHRPWRNPRRRPFPSR